MRVAIVTGASRGIGEAVARGLAADGYNLAISARSSDRLNELKKDLESSQNIAVEAFPLDVKDSDAIYAMVSAVKSRFGRADVLFNNAGILHRGTLELSEEQFKELLDVNLTGCFNVLRAVVPVMKEQGSGMIINLSSRAGKIGFAGVGGYVASKFGLAGLSESLYRELSQSGIKVTAICPSWVVTDMTKDVDIPSAEMIQCDDIVETVRWLLSMSGSAAVKEVVIECSKHIF